MKLYIATNFDHRDWIKANVTPILTAMGHEITSRWLWKQAFKVNVGDETWPEHAAKWGSLDLEDIRRADILVLDTTARLQGSKGGAHWEGGYAMARGTPVHLIGDPDIGCVFFRLPDIRVHRTWPDFFYYLGLDRTFRGTVEDIMKLYTGQFCIPSDS